MTDYTTYTERPSFATSVSVTTVFTLVSDEVEYSVSLTATDFLTVNRGDGEISVTKYDYQKLNTDIVTVTYDSKGGYTYSVAEGETETGITGNGIRTAGTLLTIVGNVEINVSSRWGHNNGLIIGNSERTANVKLTATGTADNTKHGLGMWDGADLVINNGSTLTVTSSGGDSINANGSGTVITVHGKIVTNGNITNPGKEIITSTGDVYVGKGMYKTGGSITVDAGGNLETGTYINFTKTGTMTVNGTVTVNTYCTINGTASTNASYEYGFAPNLYIGGTLTIKGGALTCNSIQLGSEDNNVSGTLNLKHSDNNLVTKSGAARYAFAQGTINLYNSGSGKCAFNVGSSKNAYVDIRSGLTINLQEGSNTYGSFFGEWVSGTYNVYVELGFTNNGTFSNFFAMRDGTKNFYFYNTKAVKIDDVDKNVIIASHNPASATSGYYTVAEMAAINAVVDGANYTSTDETATYGTLGAFTKATYTDAEGTVHTIYYQVIE